MSYDYKETSEEIIIDKGIATREMWKTYEHGKEHVSYETLTKAVQLRNRVPIVLDTVHDHNLPLTDAAKALGYADLKPCPEKRGLSVTWHFLKSKTPNHILEQIRRKETLPGSVYQFVPNVDESGEQLDLLFDHIAILEKMTPRCPPERCGVGVYDGEMKKEEEIVKPSGTPKDSPEPGLTVTSTEDVPAVQKGTKEEVKPIEKAEPAPKPEPDKDSIIKELKDKLAKRDEQVTAIRKPLMDELAARGYQAQELNPLSMSTLQKMVEQSRAASTEGLPGTVPAPVAEAPKTLTEAREAEHKRFTESLEKRQKERWKDM